VGCDDGGVAANHLVVSAAIPQPPRNRTVPPPATSAAEPLLGLLEAHRGMLYQVADSYTRQPADRADLLQQVLAELVRALPRYDRAQRFSTWMYRVALNVAISWHRREAVRGRHLTPVGPEVLEVVAAPVEDLAREADLARLDRFIHGLPPLDRALVLLHLDGQRHAEVAEVLGLSETNVGTKLGRIKERLRRELQADEEG
jgi:RNA polymerase sigma-70 factor, ECF subfamily